jgi:hypothetical protein
MVIDDFNVMHIPLNPFEAYPPLIVDADAVLTGAVTLERFQAISRRNPQIFEPGSAGQKFELSPRHALDGAKLTNAGVMRQSLGVAATKAADHLKVSLYCFSG